jgi:L-ascorbate metabolism protein UlaG (beta-lactamase superfamily)
MSLQMRWLGNAGFEFYINDTTIIVDPFLTRPKFRQLYFSQVEPDEAALREHIPACDHILVTHTHFDHCMDAPEIALRTSATVHGSANTCGIMRMAGLPAEQTHIVSSGDFFYIQDIRITVLPAAHPWLPGYANGRLNRQMAFPARLPDYRMDACYSYLLESLHSKESRILVWSSTHSTGAPPADLLTCRAVSSQHWYDKLLGQVQPRMAIPQHWDNFFQPLSETPQPFFSAPRLGFPPIERIDLQDFQSKVEKSDPGCRILLPEIFKPYEIDF